MGIGIEVRTEELEISYIVILDVIAHKVVVKLREETTDYTDFTDFTDYYLCNRFFFNPAATPFDMKKKSLH